MGKGMEPEEGEILRDWLPIDPKHRTEESPVNRAFREKYKELFAALETAVPSPKETRKAPFVPGTGQPDRPGPSIYEGQTFHGTTWHRAPLVPGTGQPYHPGPLGPG